MTPSTPFPNSNTAWSWVFAEVLFREGLRSAVISPGSRSTPLTIALVRHGQIRCFPILDERSAAFFALGLAKRQQSPTLLVCTSGTAAANYFPAIIEARESGVPLLVATADRPPELRHCASGQTIDQLKLFGHYPLFQAECLVPYDGPSDLLRAFRQMLVHAYRRCLEPQRGPVHLNLPFRDPLAPTWDKEGCRLPEDLFPHKPPEKPSPRHILRHPGVDAWIASRQDHKCILVVGPQPVLPAPSDDQFRRTLHQLARTCGAPILCDALNPLRHHHQPDDLLVTTYDTILRDPVLNQKLRPDCVIQIGPLPTSKRLRSWLQQGQWPTLVLHRAADNVDAAHSHTTQVWLAPEEWEGPHLAASTERRYAEEWQAAEDAAVTALTAELAAATATDPFFEGALIPLLADHLPERSSLFIANSMPVRAAEYFWPKNRRRFQVFHNRGANGIDGTLSTAMGLAADGEKVWLITGDLAFLHDSNGLLNHRHLRGCLTILVINNRGGGIFEHLPVAEFQPPFEEFFATPQEIDLGQLAIAHGLPYRRLRTRSEIQQALSAEPSGHCRIFEISTDRKIDAVRYQQILQRASARLSHCYELDRS